MIFRPPLLIALLFASEAWATQTPIGASNSKRLCLSISAGSPKANFDACCSGGSTSGKESVDGVEVTYTCGKWASPYLPSPVPAATARECAQLCVANPNCPASSWTSRGQCFFVNSKVYSISSSGGFLLLENTGEWAVEPEPVGECEKLVDAAKTQCEKTAAAKCEAEKAALDQSKTAECEKRLSVKCGSGATAALEDKKAQCEQEKAALSSSCDESKKKTEAQCQIEKGGLVESSKAQCGQEKASLLNDAKKQCEAEKSAQSSACETTKAQLESEKQTLQKALDDANQKLKGTGTGGGGSTTVSQTSPENEALIQEISRESFASICPRFDGKTFITTDPKGYKYEWRLYCHTNAGGASTPQVNWACHTQDIIKLLKEQQENGGFRALWVNTNNVCTPWIGGTVIPGGPFLNHHLVLPTRQPWK